MEKVWRNCTLTLNTVNVNEPQMEDRFVEIDAYCGKSVAENGTYERTGSLIKGALFMLFKTLCDVPIRLRLYLNPII